MRRWSCTTCLPFFVMPNCLTSHLPLPAQLMRSPSLTILLADVTSFQLSLHHSCKVEPTIHIGASMNLAPKTQQGVGNFLVGGLSGSCRHPVETCAHLTKDNVPL